MWAKKGKFVILGIFPIPLPEVIDAGVIERFQIRAQGWTQSVILRSRVACFGARSSALSSERPTWPEEFSARGERRTGGKGTDPLNERICRLIIVNAPILAFCRNQTALLSF